MKKIVLAYSGGLDTSCIIPWLKDRHYDVVAFIANVGQNDNFKEIEKRALDSGAIKVHCVDLQNEFINEYVFPALKARAVYEDKYYLACALSRPLIAKHLVRIAEEEKADGVSHGCTGKGNDQVRFETTVRLMRPDLEILAPVRTWEFKTRDQEIEFAQSRNIPVPVTKKSPYSIDYNVYGRAIECGVLEDPDQEPPEDIYAMTAPIVDWPDQAEYVDVTFEKGVPIQVNGKTLNALSVIETLNQLGGQHGVGRVDMVENRLVGIKSREIYENPAGTILHTGIAELEALVLDRETIRFKSVLSQKYAELTYNGLWFTPLKDSMDAFFADVMQRVSGDVRLKLFKGQCVVAGRTSSFSRYQETLATYGEKDTFDQSLAEGFNQLWAMPYMS